MRLARASSRSAAAASDGAAAQAGRDRQALRQREAAELESLDPLGERARGLEHQIVGDRAGRAGGRPAHGERERSRRA